MHGPTVMLLMNCYIRNKFCLNQVSICLSQFCDRLTFAGSLDCALSGTGHFVFALFVFCFVSHLWFDDPPFFPPLWYRFWMHGLKDSLLVLRWWTTCWGDLKCWGAWDTTYGQKAEDINYRSPGGERRERSSLKGREKAIVYQTNIRTMGKLLRDGAERI